MSAHWCPDEGQPVRLVAAPADAAAALREASARSRRSRLPEGARTGLLLVAMVCAGVVFALHSAFGRTDVFAEEVVAPGATKAVTE